jgi:hypothetical protein
VEVGNAEELMTIEKLMNRSDDLQDSGTTVDVLGYGRGQVVGSKKGGSFIGLVKQHYGSLYSKAVAKGVINHPLNSKMKMTSKFGYQETFGQKGPYLAAKYAGVNTKAGTGSRYNVFWMPEV